MSDWNKDVLLAENGMIIEKQNATIVELEQENKTLHKALELLIENIELESCYYCPCGNCGCCKGSGKECFEFIKEHFIQQAKESLDEKG